MTRINVARSLGNFRLPDRMSAISYSGIGCDEGRRRHAQSSIAFLQALTATAALPLGELWARFVKPDSFVSGDRK
jgi:hypothetical protein